MLSLLQSLISDFGVADFLDIALLSVLIYWVIVISKGTRALSMLIGLGVGLVGLWLTSYFEVRAINLVLTYVYKSLPLIIIVLFQHEIRRLLTRIGKQPFFGAHVNLRTWVVDELVKACLSLASKKIGALILIELETEINDFIELGHGHLVDARVSRELILSIFTPSSPMHDGAMTIKNDRITRAGCFLPLSTNQNLGKHLGTRHRAAIGITEHVDVLTLIVSEETGQISAARGGRLLHNLDQNALRSMLLNIYDPRLAAKTKQAASAQETYL